MTELHVAPGFALPLEAATETFAILAVKRAGNSNAAVVMAEEMYDAGVPWVAIDPKGDWWGVRADGDGEAAGLSVLGFGGLHGDVPLEPGGGRLVADLVVDQRITCVLDVSEMTKADQRRFLIDFADRLYRRNTEPLHVFCEEADEYIPQRVTGEVAQLVGAFETLVKRGGFRGVGITLITQRSAALNKDVLTQAGTLVAMRTPSPQDRKAVLAWIDYHQTGREVVDELPMLEDGEAWVFSPQWLRTLRKIRFRRRRTFDSGATPKVGGKPRPPARLADVDLAAIKEAMAETIERAKADDPRELRKRIRDLERQLADRPVADPETVVETVEVPFVDDDMLARLEAVGDPVFALSAAVRDLLLAAGDLKAGVYTPKSTRPPSPRRPERPDLPRPASRPPVAAGDGNVRIGAGERKILGCVAQYPDGVTREQLTVLTGYKRSSRDTYIQRLRQAGHVSVDGGRIVASADGVRFLGDDYEPLPTGAELREHWLRTLPEGEMRLLSLLLDAWPDGVSRDDLSEITGYKRSSRDTYLQRLRSRQLIDTSRGDPRAVDTLFEDR